MQDEDFFRERGFGLSYEIGKRPAFIVIDMIKGFTDPDVPLGSDLSMQISNINTVLQTAHSLGAPVMFSTISYDGNNFAEAGIWPNKMSGLKQLVRSSALVQLDERLTKAESDLIVNKHYASCFFGTSLSSILTALKVDTVLLAGCTTSGCVRATAVDAMQFGFVPIVIEDAVGDRSHSAHEQTLFDLKQKYADLWNSYEVVKYLYSLR